MLIPDAECSAVRFLDRLRWLQSRTPPPYAETTGAGVLQVCNSDKPVAILRNTFLWIVAALLCTQLWPESSFLLCNL